MKQSRFDPITGNLEPFEEPREEGADIRIEKPFAEQETGDLGGFKPLEIGPGAGGGNDPFAEFRDIVRNAYKGKLTAQDQIGEEPLGGTKPLTAERQKLVVARQLPTGEVVYGKPGQIHADLMAPDEPWNALMHYEMGFATPGGKFMSRQQALEYATKNEPQRAQQEHQGPGLEASQYVAGKAISADRKVSSAMAEGIGKALGAEEPVSARQQLEKAYLDITKGRIGQAVNLSDLRAKLPHIDRKTMDAALADILKGDEKGGGAASLMRHDDPRQITPAMKAGAFNPAGEPFHVMWLSSKRSTFNPLTGTLEPSK